MLHFEVCEISDYDEVIRPTRKLHAKYNNITRVHFQQVEYATWQSLNGCISCFTKSDISWQQFVPWNNH